MNAKELRTIMNQQRLKPKHVAELARVSLRYVYHWLAGTKEIPVKYSELLMFKINSMPRVISLGDNWSIK